LLAAVMSSRMFIYEIAGGALTAEQAGRLFG
jgi:hypothetical protein